MDDNLEQQVRDLDRRLRALEQHLSDDRRRERRRHRRGMWVRIGLILFLGGTYLWYLVMVTGIL